MQENAHSIQWDTDLELLIRARPTKYELLFSVARSVECAGTDFNKLGEITTSALTVRHPGRESPNTGAHFAIYAQGAYGMPVCSRRCFRLRSGSAYHGSHGYTRNTRSKDYRPSNQYGLKILQ